MKRIILILLTAAMLLALPGCGHKSKEETGLLRIGVLEPLSGKHSTEGLRETLGIQYANAAKQTVTIKKKTYRIELVIKDNGSDAAASAKAAEELVEAGCAVVIGSAGNELAAAASDVFCRAGVAAIAATGSDSELTRGNDHYFRICALPEFQGSVLASFAKKTLSAKCAYCIAESGNAEDAALLRSFRETADALGIKIVAAEFPANNVDFAPYLNAAKDEGASVIFAPCAVRYAQRILEQIDPQDGALPLLADARWRDAAILNALQEKELSVYVSSAYAEGADPNFEEGFKAWLNGNSEALANNGATDVVYPESVFGYDAYFTALSAVEMRGSTDKADILAILPRVARTGTSGSYSFDEDGAAVRSALWIEKANPKNGAWELVGAAKVG